ncbi:unnamed protein product [Acanthoscelides obtectus]|uniref:DDE Tnp4 domain-containing protein n=1 Tax=Acanthoscelides obtectus TaxID=200917 RepID=A0A9P0M917_ACAOB|nr:unnamed protein product [Acanthoscelides obtectus]CAK1621501.1 hypothetical protein AOBTE_LOCUS996 [Acanthoscelides obtectus]
MSTKKWEKLIDKEILITLLEDRPVLWDKTLIQRQYCKYCRLARNMRYSNGGFWGYGTKTKTRVRYAASGCSFKDLHYTYRVGVSTVSNIIKEVSRCIWNNLSEKCMRLPTSVDEWEQIASGFNKKANFPHCLGAVDGKHIRLKKPLNSGSLYINYKDFFPSYY